MAQPRLCTGPRHDVKRDMDTKARRAAHARAWEVCTSRITRFVADEIHRPAMRLLEEIASGAKRGPGELMEQTILVAREHKAEVDAIAPLAALANRLGYALAPLDHGDGRPDVIEATAEAGKEFGEAAGALLEAGRDLRNPLKRESARREALEAIAALHKAVGEMDDTAPQSPTVA